MSLSQKIDARTKMLHRAIGGWIFCNESPIELKGSDEQVAAATAVAIATKMFKETLERSDVTLGEVSVALQRKLVAAQQFKRVFGTDWLL